MFSKMPKLLIVAFLLIYLNAVLWWTLEASNPDLPKTFVMGVPAAFWYGNVWSCFILNVFIAWILSKV
ncbi:MAG: hypothetical protein ACPLSJ_02440 [Thermosulfidibacteraceae bacterium]|jgi:hypothetical protein